MWLWQDPSRSEHAAVGKQGRSTFCTYICGNQKHQNRFLSICWYYRFSHFTFVLTVLSLNFSIIHDSMTRGLFVIRYTSYMSFFFGTKNWLRVFSHSLYHSLSLSLTFTPPFPSFFHRSVLPSRFTPYLLRLPRPSSPLSLSLQCLQQRRGRWRRGDLWSRLRCAVSQNRKTAPRQNTLDTWRGTRKHCSNVKLCFRTVFLFSHNISGAFRKIRGNVMLS